MDPDADLRAITTIVVAGFLLPLFGAVLLHDVFSLYVSGRQYMALAAAGLCLIAWGVLAVLDPDRPNFVFATVVFPWILALLLGIVLTIVGPHLDGVTYVIVGIDDMFYYAAAIMFAGLGAVALHRGFQRLWEELDRVPELHIVAASVVGLVTVGLLVGGGYATTTATTASVSDVEAEVLDRGAFERGPVGLAITVDGDPTELRLTVWTPDGTTITERIPPGDLQDGTSTVQLPGWEVNAPLDAGTYEVTLSALSGVTVDRTVFVIETEASPTLEQVAIAAPGEELDLDPASDGQVRRTGAEDDIRIATVVSNDGEVPGVFTTRLMMTDGEFITLQDLAVDGDGTGVNVQGLAADDARHVHDAHDGRLVVEVLHDGDVVAAEEVTVPVPRSSASLDGSGT